MWGRPLPACVDGGCDLVWFELLPSEDYRETEKEQISWRAAHLLLFILFQRAPVASLREQVIHRTHRNSGLKVTSLEKYLQHESHLRDLRPHDWVMWSQVQKLWHSTNPHHSTRLLKLLMVTNKSWDSFTSFFPPGPLGPLRIWGPGKTTCQEHLNLSFSSLLRALQANSNPHSNK